VRCDEARLDFCKNTTNTSESDLGFSRRFLSRAKEDEIEIVDDRPGPNRLQ